MIGSFPSPGNAPLLLDISRAPHACRRVGPHLTFQVLHPYLPGMPSDAPVPPAEMGALLASVFAGDRGAARDLTERILLPVLDAAVSRLLLGPRRERFEKTDVIQEVFQHLYQDNWRWLRSYDATKGSLANYLWAVAKGWLRDHARRLPPPRPIEDMESEVSPDSGPERKAVLGQMIDRVHDELSTEEVALFQWVYLAGDSRAVVAERLEITQEAAHKRVQRLESKIRGIVSEGATGDLEAGESL